jgi:outer membrane protein OmpA-like peptidoglycan-associated protein
MKSFGIVCLLLLLAACEQRSSLDEPPPPPARNPAPVHVRHTPARQKTVPAQKAVVATAGPLKTAMVGEYMDAQEKDFRARLRPTGALVSRVGDDLVVSWRNDMLFKGDDISGRGRGAMQQLTELLRHYDHSVVQVSGFTDTGGSPGEDLEHSQRRAKAVADALVVGGVSADRVSSQGLGAAHLKIATGPGKSEPRNRRIEVRVIAHPQA